MPRSNSSVPRHRKHRKLVKQAKGYFGTRKSNYRTVIFSALVNQNIVA